MVKAGLLVPVVARARKYADSVVYQYRFNTQETHVDHPHDARRLHGATGILRTRPSWPGGRPSLCANAVRKVKSARQRNSRLQHYQRYNCCVAANIPNVGKQRCAADLARQCTTFRAEPVSTACKNTKYKATSFSEQEVTFNWLELGTSSGTDCCFSMLSARSQLFR